MDEAGATTKNENTQSILVNFMIAILRTLLKIFFVTYDLITYIPNKIFASPANVLQLSKQFKATPTIPGDPASPWRSVEAYRADEFLGCDTIGKVWDECVRRYGMFDCYGVRPILSVQYEKQPNGRVFEKVKLGDYQWTTYNEASEQVHAIAKGLMETGMQPKERVVTFSDTCVEWTLSALACYKCNFPISTVYATLGDEAVLYAINECQATLIFVSAANLPKLARIISQCKYLRIVVYYPFRDPEAKDEIPQAFRGKGLQIISFKELMEAGMKSARLVQETVEADDLALIMYTSGTTGNPKGVLITHKNMLTASFGHSPALRIGSDDIVICYLPQAHIFELCLELGALRKGCRIGFASVQTLLDHATKLMPGQVSDCRALKPTYIGCVPTIMKRIRKEVEGAIQRSPIKFAIYQAFLEWAESRFVAGYPSFALDKILFKRIREILGGKMRTIISGGASLDDETQMFMTIMFGCQVLQGYGLTETSGGGAIQSVDDRSMGNVGPPITCCEIMLKEWKEGGYSPNNERPQGEILISGDCLSAGYLNKPEKTAEDFVMVGGKRWFCTGDIGEFNADGKLCIIDRKKDLVKLSHGEYIALGKVETVIINNPFVDNICLYAGFNKSFLVALVVPDLKSLAEMAKKIGVTEEDENKLYKYDKIKVALLTNIQQFCKGKLLPVEIPQKIYICPEAWTPKSGLVTEALKLKRKNIEKAFKNEIEQMYAE